MIAHRHTDIDWLRVACMVASDRSDDRHTKNGAVLVPKEPGFVAVAANSMPRGTKAVPERLERPAKYQWLEHAERGVIYAAARQGVKTDGATLYCPWFACIDCARAIIVSGVREVVGHVVTRQLTPPRWEEQITAAEAMLRESGVSLRWLADRVGARLLFDGKEIDL